MFKRLLVLAAVVALFVTAIFVHFYISDAQIENGFRQEREKFHVNGVALTTANPPVLQEAAPAPLPPIAVPPTPDASAPTSTDTKTDSDPIIGPVPPAASPDSSSTPGMDATPATPAAAPDTNAPANPSSTLVYPGLSHLPFLVTASYNTSGIRVQTNPVSVPSMGGAPVPATMQQAPVPAAPTTNAEMVPSSATNAAPAMGGVTPRHSLIPVPGSVIILGYHQFTGPGVASKNIYSMRQDVFDGEMKYLKDNNYHVVPVSDVVRYIKHEIGLPPNSVAVTIDDGYKSAIVWAAPVLKKYGFPWTYFVYPDFITVAEGKGAASWNDLLQLQADGVDVECHSKTHPILSSHTQKFNGSRHVLTPVEYDQFLTDETAGAKATLEQHLHKEIKYFAYPYGAYNKEVQAKVVAAGFEAVFTVANNPVHQSTDLHSIGRYIITTPVEKSFTAYLRQGALSVADASPAPGATISDPRPIITAVLGYAGNLDPNSISAEVRDYGEVRHDFDPNTLTVRLYLPRDLIQPVVIVNIRAQDATNGQKMVASWRFNYVPAAPGLAHPPIPGMKTTLLAVPETSATAIPAKSAPVPMPDASATTAAAMPGAMTNQTPATNTAAPGTNAPAPSVPAAP